MTRLFSIVSSLTFAVLLAGCSTIGGNPSGRVALESYDFYYAPTFLRPVHFIIERHTDSYILRQHAYRGKGGYDPKKLRRTKTKELTEANWNTLIAIIDEGGFWTDSVRDIKGSYLDATLIQFVGKRPQEEKEIWQYGEYSFFLIDLLERLEEL